MNYYLFAYGGYSYKPGKFANSWLIEAKDKRQAKKIFREFVRQNLDKYTVNKMMVHVITRERYEFCKPEPDLFTNIKE